LVVAELTERYGVTRGAVRQALMSLEGEGLVERERNRGARVRSISLDEAIEITEARAVLEGLCAAKAAVKATRRERDELRRLGDVMADAVAAEDVMRYSSTTQDLHRYVREVARQQTVADLLDRLRYQSVRYHFSVALLPDVCAFLGDQEASAKLRAIPGLPAGELRPRGSRRRGPSCGPPSASA
jgi:DNA-binding GntR family transcriptional regulator